MPNLAQYDDRLTLLEAHLIAKKANMYLVTNGQDVCVSPHILPGWREIPIKVKVASSTRGNVCTDERAAA